MTPDGSRGTRLPKKEGALVDQETTMDMAGLPLVTMYSSRLQVGFRLSSHREPAVTIDSGGGSPGPYSDVGRL